MILIFPAPCCPFPALRSREAPPAPSFPNFLWREAKRSRNSTKSKRGKRGGKARFKPLEAAFKALSLSLNRARSLRLERQRSEMGANNDQKIENCGEKKRTKSREINLKNRLKRRETLPKAQRCLPAGPCPGRRRIPGSALAARGGPRGSPRSGGPGPALAAAASPCPEY